MASDVRPIYSLFGPDGGKSIVAPKESSRAGVDALDLEGAVFDMHDMLARPWLPYSFGEGGDGVYRAVFVQVDPDVDENVPAPRIVLRVGDREGSGAARKALSAFAPMLDGEGPRAVPLVDAGAFLDVAAKAHEAGRLSIGAENVRTSHVGVVDLYM